jgi:hypothetical protein
LVCVMKRSNDTHTTSGRLARAMNTNLIISPTHKRTEGRAPVWGSEFTSKDAALQGGIQQKPLLG